MNKTIFNA
jgi:hypothetical protein